MKIQFDCLFRFGRVGIAVGSMLTGALTMRADLNQAPGSNSVVVGTATVSSIGPNSRTWSLPLDTNLLSFVSPNSPVLNMTNSQFAELATGMNYLDGQQWSPSVASFQAASNGFAASQTQHKVFLNGNLNIIGAVTITTPDGTNLYSSPIAIALYDAASGNMSIIGTITNCSGTQTESNTVVYQNAFNGVCANVVYTIDRGAFHQDVVLTGGINPVDYGYPSNTTRIQIITEFENPPTPERVVRPIHVEQNQDIRNQMATPDLMDEMLGFGHFTFGAGRAYLAPKASPTDPGAPVGKQLFNVNGRILLVESVEYKYIWRSMSLLPPCNGGTNSPGGFGAFQRAGKGKAAYAAVPKPTKAGSMAANPKANPKNGVASVAWRGLVIDYTADVSSMDDPTLFQSDTTYFIEGTVYCDGATTIEGGAVFKYPLAVGSFSSGASISINSSLTLMTSSYRPAIFTAADDDSVGTKMNISPYSSYYTGNPGGYYNSSTNYCGPYLSLACSVSTLNHVNFCYASEALYINGEASYAPMAVAHSQFVNCIQGIELDSGSYAILSLNNCLVHNVQYVFTDYGSEGDSYYLNNCTLHQSTNTVVVMSSDSTPGIVCTNCVVVNVSNGPSVFTGHNNGFYNSPDNGSTTYDAPSYPFDTALSGGHYLDPGSGFQGVGTTNIDAGLLADLRTMTTYAPPDVVSNALISYENVLWPQIPRDTNLGTVDLGYHYDPIDFVFSQINVATNSTLTLTSGVVVATYGSVGINFASNTVCYSFGTPLTHNIITQTRAVQESPDAWAASTTYSPFTADEATGSFYLRFTDVTFLPKAYSWYNLIFGGTVPSTVTMQDCRLTGAGFWDEVDSADPVAPVMTLANNVFERCYFDLEDSPPMDGSPGINLAVGWNNNEVYGGIVLSAHCVGNWYIYDNLFDTVTNWDYSSTSIHHYNNGYFSTTVFGGTTSGNKSGSSFTYAAGPLGSYYQPSGSILRNEGSRTAAAAGLYHYTVGTDEVKEGTNTVTIGLHYVALNDSGQPDDTGGSGIPDYLADTNGNGVYDAATDLSNWKTNSTAGDGISDLSKYLLGFNIKVNSTTTPPVPDTSGLINLQVYTPLR